MNGPVECHAQLSESCLSSEDIDHIKMLVSHFVVNALMPFVETQMQYLNEMVNFASDLILRSFTFKLFFYS